MSLFTLTPSLPEARRPGVGAPFWGPLPPTATLHGVQELQGVALSILT